jgi:hypothetical protein
MVARYGAYASYPRLNIGTPTCYVGGMNWPVSQKLWVGQKPQVQLPIAAGELRSWKRTPNTFQASVALNQPARLRFNQNFARGFVSNHGSPVDDDGLLALDLPAGEHEVELRYRPPEFSPSAAVSGIGLVTLVLLLLRRKVRSAQSAPASPSSASTPVRAGAVP